MHLSFVQVIASLLAGVGCIILLTVKFRLHPFFALLIACFVTGIGTQMPIPEILQLIKSGFGDIVSKLCLIIVLGTAIGVLLEKNGSTEVMAGFIIRLVGIRRSALAISLTGFIVGLPIFCDSGYIVLNGINRSLTRRTGMAVAQMSISLASGLYAVHCLIPPHPGATAAAAKLQVDVGKLILIGLPVAIPAMLVGYWWSMYAGKRSPSIAEAIEPSQENKTQPRVWQAFLPVLMPVLLMAGKSISGLGHVQQGFFYSIINTMGDPSVALFIGLLLALLTGRYTNYEWSSYLSQSAEKAAGILVIIGAGGAFGAVLAATDIGHHFGNHLNLGLLGIWFPFLLTAVIKTAQGSSTVAIITASSIVLPLLPVLGLTSENALLLTVLAMGAGSMMVSHTNDAYFWVISKFSGIDIRTMLRVHSMASVLMGLVTMLVIYLLSLFAL